MAGAPAGTPASATEYARLVRELEEAELYEQNLRAAIVAIRDMLAAGQAERALSMLNGLLNGIDNATDVVVPASPDAPQGR